MATWPSRITLESLTLLYVSIYRNVGFTLNYKYSTPEVILPGALLPSLEFLSGVQSGLYLIVLANGEPAALPVNDSQKFPDELAGYARLAADLDYIQRKSGIYFPMPRSLSLEEQENILTAKELLAGEVVSGEWTSSRMTMPGQFFEGV